MYKNDLFSPIYEIDPQAEWQAKYGQDTSTGQNADLVMSKSQLEESLFSDAETIQGFAVDSVSDTVDVDSSNRSYSPVPMTSTPTSEPTANRNQINQAKPKMDNGHVSANISVFEKSTPAASEPTKHTYKRKSPISTPREKKVEEIGNKPGINEVVSPNAAEAKRPTDALGKETNNTEKIISTTPIQVKSPSRVMFLDDSYFLRPIENEKQLVELVKNPFLPLTSSMDDILVHLTTNPVDMMHHFSLLGQHINTLHQSDQLLDVVIYLGNQIFKAHRVVLSCYSKYFADSFVSASGKTKIPLEVKLNGISTNAFRLFLEFVYSGCIIIQANNIGELAIAAELLDIGALKERISVYMDAITVDQALVVVETGKIPLSSEIHRLSYDCVMEHFCESYGTNVFNMLSLENVCIILRDDRLVLETEMDIFWAGLRWIGFQMKERQQHMTKVMECVRFPYLSQADIFKCLEATDLLKSSERCRQLLITANWIVSSEERKKIDVLDLPKPLNRLCFRKEQTVASNDTFVSIADDFTISLPDLRDTFSCEVVMGGDEKLEGTQPPVREEGTTPIPTARSISPAFMTGDILVIGGFQQDNKDTHTVKHIERYSTYGNQWKYYADLPEPRHHHAATMLSGKIYITGGVDPKTKLTRRMPTATNTVYQFDTERQTWSRIAPMNTYRMHHRLCAMYGMLYAIGGEDNKSNILSSVECYNPKTNGWMYVQPMKSARMGASAAVSDGKLYVAGGQGGQMTKRAALPILQSLEAFDPRSNQWSQMPDLRIPRCFATMVAISSKLYLCGGASRSYPAGKDESLSSVGLVEMFDLKLQKWEYVTEMIIPRHHHGVAVIGSNIFLIGGMSTTNNKTLQSIECIDTKTNKWNNRIQDLTSPAKWICCVVLPVANHT